MSLATDILDQTKNVIGNSRAVEYDSPNGERSMEKAVEIFNAITRKNLTEAEGWTFMLALKLARSTQGKPKLDTYIDLAGYSALLGECVIERDPRNA